MHFLLLHYVLHAPHHFIHLFIILILLTKCINYNFLYNVTLQCYFTMLLYNITLQCYFTMLLYNVTLQCYFTMFLYNVTFALLFFTFFASNSDIPLRILFSIQLDLIFKHNIQQYCSSYRNLSGIIQSLDLALYPVIRFTDHCVSGTGLVPLLRQTKVPTKVRLF